MTSYLELNYQELACLADALACLRRDPLEMVRMGHTFDSVTAMHTGIRRVMSDYPQFEKE